MFSSQEMEIRDRVGGVRGVGGGVVEGGPIKGIERGGLLYVPPDVKITSIRQIC